MCVWRGEDSQPYLLVLVRCQASRSALFYAYYNILQHTTPYSMLKLTLAELAESLLRCIYRSYNIYHYLRYLTHLLYLFDTLGLITLFYNIQAPPPPPPPP